MQGRLFESSINNYKLYCEYVILLIIKEINLRLEVKWILEA